MRATPFGAMAHTIGTFGTGLYALVPKRRDHQPALRGASPVASGDGAAGAGSGRLCATGGGPSDGALLVAELTFSRTVERRRAALSVSCTGPSGAAASAPSRSARSASADS